MMCRACIPMRKYPRNSSPPSDGGTQVQAVKERLRIIGIDPGSRVTGYGLIDSDGSRLIHVDSGCIRAGDGDMAARLRRIYEGVGSLLSQWHPDELAVERVFLSHNADSALKLGQARATAICASFRLDLPVHEYAARSVKQAVVGTGGADKDQVAHMIKALLSMDTGPRGDEADALAVAVCHAHSRSAPAVLAGARAGRRRR